MLYVILTEWNILKVVSRNPLVRFPENSKYYWFKKKYIHFKVKWQKKMQKYIAICYIDIS